MTPRARPRKRKSATTRATTRERSSFGALALAEAEEKRRGPRDHELPKEGEDPVAWRARNAVRQLETLAFALSIPDLEPDLRMYAAAKLDVIWEAIHGLRAGSWPRLVFMRCINMGAEDAKKGNPDPEKLALAAFLVFERPLGLKLSELVDPTRALVKAWAETEMGREARSARKWKLAASLWIAVSGEKVTAETMRTAWERDRGKAHTNKRRGDS